MNTTTGIEWTDATSNPVKYRDRETGRVVWACVKHSAGCKGCYAEVIAQRFGRGGPFTRAEMAKVEPFLCEKEVGRLLKAKSLAGKRVFLGDMTDIFGEWVPDDLLNRLFSGVLEVRTDVTFQLLTKRADRLSQYLSWRWGEGRIPARNIHVGVSVENQAAADERIPLLLRTPAAVRFLSCEPLLGPIDLSDYLRSPYGCDGASPQADCEVCREALLGVDWVIVGGESGPGARPCQLEWVRSIVQRCQDPGDVGPRVFVKQLGDRPTAGYYDEFRAEWEGVYGLDWPDPIGWEIRQLGQPPLTARVALPLSKKGGDVEEWPEDLQVREFPEAPARA